MSVMNDPIVNEGTPEIDPADAFYAGIVVGVVANVWKVPAHWLYELHRGDRLAEARQVICWVLHRNLSWSADQIATRLIAGAHAAGDACQEIEERRATEDELQRRLQMVLGALPAAPSRQTLLVG